MKFQLATSRMDEVTMPCPVKGHSHVLNYLYSLEQADTGAQAHKLECPTGKYRFLLIPEAFKRTGEMPRYRRPRYGWPKE